jgi:hypothetical protein
VHQLSWLPEKKRKKEEERKKKCACVSIQSIDIVHHRHRYVITTAPVQ